MISYIDTCHSMWDNSLTLNIFNHQNLYLELAYIVNKDLLISYVPSLTSCIYRVIILTELINKQLIIPYQYIYITHSGVNTLVFKPSIELKLELL